jgi:hypothetical protein
MFQDVEQIATLNVEDDVLESDAPLFPSFASSQAKYFTLGRTAHRNRHSSVPVSVPTPGPRTVNRQPTPTKLLMKNGPEIIDFRPVL